MILLSPKSKVPMTILPFAAGVEPDGALEVDCEGVVDGGVDDDAVEVDGVADVEVLDPLLALEPELHAARASAAMADPASRLRRRRVIAACS
jgi:hypothetical protein